MSLKHEPLQGMMPGMHPGMMMGPGMVMGVYEP